MSVELKKLESVSIRSLGLNESWLQQQINNDPTLLGLGRLEVINREVRQPVRGRIDFLLYDAEETFYEVEVMLGTLDESHIIRTIEYWDIERQRRPDFNHRAVIVAEQITSRFFNVIRLFNRSVPIIAIQLSALKLQDGSIALHPITVLDVIEEIAEPTQPQEQVDRASWERKSNPVPLRVADRIGTAFREEGIEPRVTYNRWHIAIGATRNNFCWVHERRSPGYCYIEFRAHDEESREASSAALQAEGIDAVPKSHNVVGFGITEKTFNEKFDAVMLQISEAEKRSRDS